jgi:hypothetical protein
MNFLENTNLTDLLLGFVIIILLWIYDFFFIRKNTLSATEQTQSTEKSGGLTETKFDLPDIEFSTNDQKIKFRHIPDPQIPLAKQPISFDEYEDKASYIKKIPDFKKNIKNIVVDGANFIHYIKPKTQYNYDEYIEKSITLLKKKLPNKHIYFIMKNDTPGRNKNKYTDPKNPSHIKISKLAKNPFVHIIISNGDTKARDDYLAILMTELLGEKTILLSRDRYRDIQNISGSHTDDYQIFSKQEKKIKKMLKSVDDTMVGKWSFMEKNVGYTSNPELEEGFWERKPYKNSDASDKSFVFYY